MIDKQKTENPNYYAIIPASVRYDKDISANEKLMVGEINALCNKKGVCWASNDYFAKLYNVHKKTVSRWIRNLKTNGHLEIKIIRNSRNEVSTRLLIPIHKNVPTPLHKNVPTPLHKNEDSNSTSSNITSLNSSVCSPYNPPKSEELETLTIEDTKPDTTHLENEFEKFRKAYPGIKRGFNPEFSNFKKKNADWKIIIPKLIPALEAEKAYHKHCEVSEGWNPKWKNLQTWINQSCWTQEFPEIKPSNEAGKRRKRKQQPCQPKQTSTPVTEIKYEGRTMYGDNFAEKARYDLYPWLSFVKTYQDEILQHWGETLRGAGARYVIPEWRFTLTNGAVYFVTAKVRDDGKRMVGAKISLEQLRDAIQRGSEVVFPRGVPDELQDIVNREG